MGASRIAHGPPLREIELSFDGATIRALEGEPVAASMLVAGRRILSRSFRFHRPRGLMCSTGQCGWCECEVDGLPSVRTCRVPARAGLVVRSEHAYPSVERDFLGLLDLGSRLVPPTFYHHRFLRPRRLRKTYLDVIRWFGGRGRLPASHAHRERRGLRRDRADVLVVGAGPSGLAAAAGAAQAGARVIVLEADAPPFWKPTGPIGAIDAGLEVRSGSAAVGWYGGVVGVVDDDGPWEIDAGAVVVATGTYERVPLVPGADRPGVMSAALVTRLVERERILPGRRVALVGAEAVLEGLGALLSGAGATVLGPFATKSLVAITGRRGVTGIRIRDGAGARSEPADCVVFSDRSPSVELLLQAGAATTWGATGLAPIVDETGRTSVAGLFATGGAAARSGQLSAATRAGSAAAAYAREHADRGGSSRHAWPPDRAAAVEAAEGPAPGRSTTHDPPPPQAAIVCFCEDVRVREVRAEVRAGYGDPELLKRRTGALTGPCQGKYCLAALASTATAAATGAATGLGSWVTPTARPPLRPVRLGDLAGANAPAGADESGGVG